MKPTIHDAKVDWVDRVVDHRHDLIRPWFPDALPKPGVRNIIDRWLKGTATFVLPDTRHLEGGGLGGEFTVSAHVVNRGPAAADRTLVCAMTYPDGYRLATMWPGDSGDLNNTWRAWMESPDGMSIAFTANATPWVMAQRAWGARNWYEFLHGQPTGVTMKPKMVEALTKASTFGASGHGTRLARVAKHDAISGLQDSGFWLLDRSQARWLSTKDAPLAAAVETHTRVEDSARLRALYEAGWPVEAYEEWLVDQPTNGSSHHARNFIRFARQWEDTVVEAYKVMADRAKATGRPDVPTPVNSDGVPQTGEVAALCIQLGLRPITIGVMVADGTFEIDALRTLAALRRKMMVDA